MAGTDSSRNVNVKAALQYIRSNRSNKELMDLFKISPQGLADLLRQLFEKKLIKEDDLARRGLKFKIIKKPQVSDHVIIQPQPAESISDEEEFLDTVELTELLSFKPVEPKNISGEVTEIPDPEFSDSKVKVPTKKFNVDALLDKK
jgi:hypothetical protein